MVIKIKAPKKLPIVIYLFILIYYPPILKVNLLHIVSLIAYAYLLINIGMARRLVKKVGSTKHIIFFLIVGIYLLFIALGNSNNLNYSFVYVQYAIEIIPCCLMVLLFFVKNELTTEDFMDVLLWVGTIQGILSLISFAIPSFQSYTLQKAINYGFNEAKFNSFLRRRYFGFAYNLVTYTPLVQSSLLIYAIHKERTGRIRYLIFAPFLLFSAIMNARSPILLIAVGIVMMLFVGGNIKRNVALFIFTAATLVVVSYFLTRIEAISYRSYSWLMNGIEELSSIIRLDSSNSYISGVRNITNLFPQGKNFLFGTGAIVIGSSIQSVSTDIGYVNYLWLGGIVFFFVINIYFIKAETRIINNVRTNDSVKVFAVHILLTTLIFNYKMPIFLINEYSIIIILVYYISHLDYVREIWS